MRRAKCEHFMTMSGIFRLFLFKNRVEEYKAEWFYRGFIVVLSWFYRGFIVVCSGVASAHREGEQGGKQTLWVIPPPRPGR